VVASKRLTWGAFTPSRDRTLALARRISEFCRSQSWEEFFDEADAVRRLVGLSDHSGLSLIVR